MSALNSDLRPVPARQMPVWAATRFGLLIVGASVGIGVGTIVLWPTRAPLPEPVAVVPQLVKPTVIEAPEPLRVPEHAVAPPAPARQPVQAAEPLPALDHSDALIKVALNGLLGSRMVASLLATDDFARRFVATVDNLGRERAATRLWPAKSTPTQLLVVDYADGPGIAPGNADRYRQFVHLASSVDTATAMAVYQRLYPLFQQAYEELGYSGKHFNERVLEVMDQLLDTPDLTPPIMLTLPEVHGPILSTRPWTRYEFADPGLEARPAGQKLLLRMGLDNASSIKVKLAELRVGLAELSVPR